MSYYYPVRGNAHFSQTCEREAPLKNSRRDRRRTRLFESRRHALVNALLVFMNVRRLPECTYNKPRISSAQSSFCNVNCLQELTRKIEFVVRTNQK